MRPRSNASRKSSAQSTQRLSTWDEELVFISRPTRAALKELAGTAEPAAADAGEGRASEGSPKAVGALGNGFTQPRSSHETLCADPPMAN